MLSFGTSWLVLVLLYYKEASDRLFVRYPTHMTTLDQLQPGERGTIRALKPSPVTPKLLEMGLLPGREVVYKLRAPLGDPIAVRVSGYQLSLRLDEAHLVELV